MLIWIHFLFCIYSYSTIIQTSITSPIIDEIAKIKSDSIIIFQFDNILSIYKDKILQPNNTTAFRKIVYKNMILPVKKEKNFKRAREEIKKLKSIIFKEAQFLCVDSNFLKIIKNIKIKQGKALVITASNYGGYGMIESFFDWKLDIAKKLGYNFKIFWPEFDSAHLKDDQQKSLRIPFFKDGFVFCSNSSKLLALKRFIEYSKFLPKKIIVIESNRKILEEYEHFANEKNIDFVGIEYTAARNNFPKAQNIDLKVAKFQVLNLVKENVWLHDKEAMLKLQSASSNERKKIK